MRFDGELLASYRSLLETTELQSGYQEFIRLFRFLRSELERQLPDFRFQSNITENAMDYSYFSFSNSWLREQGLKLVVAFVHRTFRLEVWLSGVNRAAQCRWADRFSACSPPVEITGEPARTDYVLRMTVDTDLSDGDKTAAELKDTIKQLLEFIP